jgi:hypothetical protein
MPSECSITNQGRKGQHVIEIVLITILHRTRGEWIQKADSVHGRFGAVIAKPK